MSRPPPRDQPSPEETEALRARLVEVVAERQRLASAAFVARGAAGRLVHVLLDGTSATLVLVDRGQVVAERAVDAASLLERLGGSPRFDDLAAVLDDPS